MHKKAQNFMLLTEPKNSNLKSPKVKLTEVKKLPQAWFKGQQFEINLTSEGVAPFVVLDYKLHSGVSGHFYDNGFFVFNGKKTVIFETKQNLSEKQIKDNLIFKTLTDVV